MDTSDRSDPDAALDEVREALRRMEAMAKPVLRRRVRPIRSLLTTACIVTLPFLFLLRTATTLTETTAWPAWAVIVAAVFLSGVSATVGIALLARRIGMPTGRWTFRLGLVSAGLFCLYGLLFISPDHVKRPEIARTYHALHPVIRLALGTIVLIDGDLVVTDGAREPEAYARMNLPLNARSLHFRQADGYVHAVDLRTRGRSWLAVQGMTLFFRIGGLGVLRHTGTADHLHVYLVPGV